MNFTNASDTTRKNRGTRNYFKIKTGDFQQILPVHKAILQCFYRKDIVQQVFNIEDHLMEKFTIDFKNFILKCLSKYIVAHIYVSVSIILAKLKFLSTKFS